MSSMDAIRTKLDFIYGNEKGEAVFGQLAKLVEKYRNLRATKAQLASDQRLTQRDVILITYGDQIQTAGQSHLTTLHQWLQTHLKNIINTVHLLPFYPYTSDDGFSVVDYWQVDPALGTWEDVHALHADFKLMFDAVINHISASSKWFQEFLQWHEPYRDYFIVTDPKADLSQVTRPRALPLLTRFQTADGPKYLWTTFSTDQIDLNYKNPQVLLQIAELLLFYVSQGADLIRLDAIGYLWKEIGTSCIHLPQTHAVVQLFRALLDECAPDVCLITETNVPHRDNISYFGNGSNEAQMVYQFPLVPLMLNAIYSGHAQHLRDWAASLEKTSDTTGFFNFLASHDGMGVVPAKSLLSEDEINELVAKTLQHGGQVSYKNNSDGSQSPYELNITLFDALSDSHSGESVETKVKRFMVTQAIMLALQGVPGIYFHSLLGSPSWQAGFAETQRNRTLNRQKFQLAELEAILADSSSQASQVFNRYCDLIRKRIAQPAFHPNAAQEILSLPNTDSLFVLLRTANKQKILAIHNLANAPISINLNLKDLGIKEREAIQNLVDLVSNQDFALDQNGELGLELQPYQVVWLSTTS